MPKTVAMYGLTASGLGETSLSVQILQISTYYQRRPPQGPAFGASHGRNVRYSGKLNASEVLQSKMNGEYDVYIQGKMERRSGRPKGDILIAGIMSFS